MSDDLVSCKHCGVVFDKLAACDHVRCPICETSVRKRTPIPHGGMVHKWWTEVDA